MIRLFFRESIHVIVKVGVASLLAVALKKFRHVENEGLHAVGQ